MYRTITRSIFGDDDKCFVFFSFFTRLQLETEVGKLKDIVRKSADPKVADKIDELEKEIKKHTTDAKAFFEDKVGKPINDKYKEDIKKFSESVLKSTKEVEVSRSIVALT